MTVAAFRNELSHLSAAFASLRGCAKGEDRNEGLILSRVLRGVLNTPIPARAKAHDREHRDSLVAAVRGYLGERPALLAWLNENA